MGYALWPKPYRLRGFASQVMRLHEDLRRCVAFLGIADDLAPGGIRCFGTAFFIAYKGCRYLVTNQHIAASIGDAPYAIRLNRFDGTSNNISIDPMEDNNVWFCNIDDPDIDLAVMPFEYNLREVGYDVLFLQEGALRSTEALQREEDIGIGDFCYTIGLFRLLSGQKRNLPIVHTGNIALLPSDEKIPVQDWLGPANSRRFIEAYLIETQSLKGLSGSPCFVRGTIAMSGLPVGAGKLTAILPRADIFLLGIWQSSWDARPDEVLAIEQGTSLRVPVGMGVVVPAEKLIEILELPALQTMREDIRKQREVANAAKPDQSRT